jgi:hypothetical protein
VIRAFVAKKLRGNLPKLGWITANSCSRALSSPCRQSASQRVISADGGDCCDTAAA